MPIIAMPDGTQVQFPDDMSAENIKGLITQKFPEAVKGATAAQSPSALADVAKQIPSGLAMGVQAIPAAIPSVLNWLGKGAENLGIGNKEANAKRQEFAQSLEGKQFDIGNYLPKPETTQGAFARTGSEFVPGMVLGLPGSAVKAAGIGAVSGLASEGGGQLPGVKGTAAEPYVRAGAAILAGPAAVAASRAPAQIIGNIGTGTGQRSLETAYQAGAKGGTAGEAFRDSLRGVSDPAEVVSDAKSALSQMRQQKNVEYQSGMAGIHKDPTVLDFAPVDAALQRMQNVKNYKGQELSKSTQGVREEINQAIENWRKLDPADYHTPGGFDALKQAIGDIKDSLPYNTPQRLVAEQVYNAIRESIVKQAPGYAGVMRKYEAASNEISQAERTLSLGKKATIDTALRKLQSVMRDNVNTNYGKRADLAKTLSENGSSNLMEKLAGQANATWVPRGLNKLIAAPLAASSYLNPLNAAALPFMSPRLMAEAAHIAGRTVGGARGLLGFSRLPSQTPFGQQTLLPGVIGAELNAQNR